MNNFGVIEVAGGKSSAAPGWAYVPDSAPAVQNAASRGGRKRAAARGAQGLSLFDQSAREETRVRRELEGLDREGSRDAVIPVPTKGRAQGKHTPNVRKILQSMKTFANHLDDFEALGESSTPAPAPPREQPPSGGGAKQSGSGGARRRQAGSRASSTTGKSTPRPQQQEEQQQQPPVLTPLEREDVEMEDGGGGGDPPAARMPQGVGDVEALLASRAPDVPGDAELRALLAGPPLAYSQARGRWDEEDARYPVRVFCSVCGYWGRVKCVSCGVRVCALECLDVHREGCAASRYGM